MVVETEYPLEIIADRTKPKISKMTGWIDNNITERIKEDNIITCDAKIEDKNPNTIPNIEIKTLKISPYAKKNESPRMKILVAIFPINLAESDMYAIEGPIDVKFCTEKEKKITTQNAPHSGKFVMYLFPI